MTIAAPVTTKPGSRVPAEQVDIYNEQVVEAYRSGDSIRTIAQRHGRSYGAIHYLLQAQGVPMRARGTTPS